MAKSCFERNKGKQGKGESKGDDKGNGKEETE